VDIGETDRPPPPRELSVTTPTGPDPAFTGAIAPSWIDDESYHKFREACFQAITQVFVHIPAQKIADVGEAMALCIPKWRSIIDEEVEEEESVKYFDYEYYSEVELEDED
jgi:hypothetical protein